MAEGSAVLRTQIQQLKKDNSELLDTALANEGLKRVKVKLDQSEVEMVLCILCFMKLYTKSSLFPLV